MILASLIFLECESAKISYHQYFPPLRYVKPPKKEDSSSKEINANQEFYSLPQLHDHYADLCVSQENALCSN